MSGLFEEPDDATPLTPEERDGLIPTHVALRRELNELEQQNIIDADLWVFQRRRDPLAESFGRTLHRRMFGKVWRWAGTYRTSDKNIGIDHRLIQPRLYEALDTTRYWVEHATFPADQIAATFHHKLVFIHPFPNGNGRWSRLMADVLLAGMGRPRFTLGRNSGRSPDDLRRAYVAALRTADQHDLGPLTAFLRS